MRMFRCGCHPDGSRWCKEHHDYACHNIDGIGKPGECPSCFLDRIRSVSLSADATPTRRGA